MILFTSKCASVLVNKVAQVEHICLCEFLLHLVEFVSTNRVEVSSVELLFENLGHAQVVEVGSGALEVVCKELLVSVVFEIVGVRISFCNLLLGGERLRREGRRLSVLLRHFNYNPYNIKA